MTLPQLDYLVIACHPDDAEIGAGGAILSLKAQGAKVGVLDLTNGEPTPHGSPEIRQRETEAATAILGLDWRGNLGLPNRSLVADLDARRLVASAIRQLRPRVLITHYWEDAHPDHVAASALVDAARFWAKLTKTDMPAAPHYPAKILYFPSMHLPMHLKPSFVLDVSAHHDRKLEALRCYHSQFIAGRVLPSPGTPGEGPGVRVVHSATDGSALTPNPSPGVPGEGRSIFDDLRDRARYWGWTVGVLYGEPFLCREEVGVRDLQQLL